MTHTHVHTATQTYTQIGADSITNGDSEHELPLYNGGDMVAVSTLQI